MPKFFVESKQVDNGKVTIYGDDVNHIINVLRMKATDTFYVCDENNSQNYLVKINEFNKEKVICDILEEIQNSAESNVKVHIYQGLPKADKIKLKTPEEIQREREEKIKKYGDVKPIFEELKNN